MDPVIQNELSIPYREDSRPWRVAGDTHLAIRAFAAATGCRWLHARILRLDNFCVLVLRLSSRAEEPLSKRLFPQFVEVINLT